MNASDLIKKRFISVDRKDTIAKFMGKVYKNYIDTERDAVVLDKGKYCGMTSKRFLIKSKIDPQEMKVEKITEKTPVLSGKEDIIEVARLMFTSDRQILPVIRNKTAIGIVKAIDVIEQIKNMPDLRNLELGEIATTHPITINENERIGKAVEIIRENNISRIPVVDEKGKVINIVSLRDIIHKYLFFMQKKSERRGPQQKTRTRGFNANGFETHALPVKDLATPIIITEKEETKVRKAIDDLRRFNISSIVVTRFNEPVGIVTIRDLLKLLLREQITY